MKRIIYIDNFLVHHGFAPTTGYALVPMLQKLGFQVIHASDKKNKLSRLLHMLSTIARYRTNAVVLIATYSTSAFYFAYCCASLCRSLGIPYIPCLHGGNLPDRIATSPRLAKLYFGGSIMNVAVSGYLHEVLVNKGWRCTIIPNAIAIAHYPFKLRTSAAPKLLWVRSFHKVYNPQMAIHVLYQLRKLYNGATLTMVGPDKDGSLAACQALAAKLKVENSVAFTGILPKEAWIQLAAAHDIFINTTMADNLPVSVIEAMALGLVVVSTNVGGVPFLVQDGENGLLCAVNNVTDMVSKIAELLENAAVVQTISNNAYLTSQQYDEAIVAEQWSNLLSRL